ncbi:MAG: PfkB family carbohydrate kinase, partial [Actinomycetota bacterium]|nr:PfkB family carbohydrate kinase [Actinomycetota bacterium]
MISETALRDRIATFRDLTVVIFGDFSLDAYWDLNTDEPELSVETGQPVNDVIDQRYGLGAGGNVATALRAMGTGTVRAVGVCGSDPFGYRLLAEMDGLEIDRAGVIMLPEPWQTMVYAKPHRDEVEQSRMDFGSTGALPDGVLEALLANLDAALEGADALIVNQQIVSGLYPDAVLDHLRAIVAARPELTCVVDTRHLGVPIPQSVLKLNCREATTFAHDAPRESLPDADALELASRIARDNTTTVFLTRGEDGIVVADGEQASSVLPIDCGSRVDPVGAGDVVTAALAATLGSGGTALEAGTIANLAAAHSVRSLRATGASTVTPEAVVGELASDVVYAPGLAEDPTRARFLEGTEHELVVPALLDHATPFTHVIFDHDGTLSTLREGWEELMAPMMLKAVLGPAYGNVPVEQVTTLRTQVADLIDRTTGIQTLLQMRELIALVREWGFVPASEVLDEHGYKAIYNDLLVDSVNQRIAKLRSGKLAREDFHMKNALPLLQALRDRGLKLYLASGTDEPDVIAEANELGFGEFFEDRIYGSTGVVTHDAKRMVIERILAENDLDGSSLLTFGDGPV